MRKFTSLLFVTVALTACGKKGPLIYPEMLMPAAPADVSVYQSGNAMKLAFVLPSRDLSGRNLAGLSAITIIKRDEPAGQPPGCNSCTTDFAPFRKINLDLLPSDTRRYGSQVLLLDGAVLPERRYTYLLAAVTKDNQESKFSVPAAAVMVTAPQPPVLQAISQPTEIQLEFVGLPSREGVMVGYNVYRALKSDVFSLLPLNKEPLMVNRFVDTGLERGVSYIYGVRTVVRLPSGSKVESGLSNTVDAQLKDDE